MNRIEQHPILSVPKDRPCITFHFDGEEIPGFEGEPVASALIAAGHPVFSYHHGDRTQGVFAPTMLHARFDRWIPKK